jgi:hypothetical protein
MKRKTPSPPPSSALIVKEVPDCRNEFLRFQVGRMEQRPELFPVLAHDGEQGWRVLDHRETGGQVTVFRLLGFGETLARAEAMAGVKV